MLPACSFNTLDRPFAEKSKIDVNIIRAAREIYQLRHKDAKFETLEEYKDIPAFINEIIEKDNKEFTKHLLCGDSKLTDANVDQMVTSSFGSYKNAIRILEAFKNVYYIVMANKLARDDDGNYIDEKTQKIVEDYKITHNNVEPSEDYILKHSSINDITRSIIEYMKLKITLDSVTDIDLLQKLTDNPFMAAMMMWKMKDVIYQDLGIKFGKKTKFAIDASSIETTGILSEVNLEETIRDGWQIETDKENPIRDVPMSMLIWMSRFKVKKNVFDEKSNKPKVMTAFDYFGFERTGAVTDIMTELLNIVGNTTNYAQMDHILHLMKGKFNNPTIDDMIDELDKPHNSKIRNAFFAALNKTSANIEGMFNKGTTFWFDKYSSDRHILKAYERRVNTKVSDNPMSIFNIDEDGRAYVNADNWRDFSAMTTGKNTPGRKMIIYDENGASAAELVIDKNLLSNGGELSDKITADNVAKLEIGVMLSYLNITLSKKEMDALLRNKQALNDLLRNLYMLGKTDVPADSRANLILKGEKSSKAIKGIFRAINNARKNTVRMIRINDSNYATFVMSNKFSNDLNAILYYKKLADLYKMYEDNDDALKANLEKVASNIKVYIKEKYINHNKEMQGILSELKTDANGDQAIILSEWIDKLYNTTAKDLLDPSSFINNFGQTRLMEMRKGTKSVMADRMSESQGLENFFKAFLVSRKEFSFKDEESNKPTVYVRVPLFTSGDSQTVRTVSTVYHHDVESIARQIAKYALSEVHRMNLQARLKEKYESTDRKIKVNTGSVTYFADKSSNEKDAFTGKFSLLYFLNDDESGKNYQSILKKAYDSGKFEEAVVSLLLGKDMTFSYAYTDEKGNGQIEDVKIEFQSERDGLLYQSFLDSFWDDAKKLKIFTDTFKEGNKDDGKTVYRAFNGLGVYQNFADSSEKNFKSSSNMNLNPIYAFYLHSLLGYCEQFMFTHYNPVYAGKTALKQSVSLQKRNKANYTPGRFLNVDAKDSNGEWFIERDRNGSNARKERVLIFKEVKRKLSEREELHKYLEELLTKEYDPTGNSIEGKATIKRILDLYDDIKSTDGQGFRTLKSMRAVLGCIAGATEWTSEMESDYLKIQQIRQNTWERSKKQLKEKTRKDYDIDSFEVRNNARFTAKEIDEICTLSSKFQSLKPHTSSIEQVKLGDNDTSDIINIPTEHKLSETLLIPELYSPNNKLKALAIEMELNNIDTAMSEEAVKIGPFGAIPIFHEPLSKEEQQKNPNKPTYEEFSEYKKQAEEYIDESTKEHTPKNYVQYLIEQANKEGLIHEIDYSDYTVQINVPFHMNESQLIGTQSRKHMIDGLLRRNGMGSYNLKTGISNSVIASFRLSASGRKLDLSEDGTDGNTASKQGRNNALKLYNALVCSSFIASAKSMAGILKNVPKFQDVIISMKGTDRASCYTAARQYATRTVEGEGGKTYTEFINPLSDPMSLYKTEEVCSTIFKKNIQKQHMLGGSAVQMTDIGYNLHTFIKHRTNDNTEETFSECVTTWDYSYTDEFGNEIQLKYSDYVDDNGNLIALDKEGNIVNPMKEDASDEYDYDRMEKEGIQFKLDKEFPGIRDMIAYRIPTERDYSILNLKAVHFTPPIMGGVISTPYHFVRAAGFDFDIDKLYFFRREYKAIPFPERDSEDVWYEIYGLHENSKGIWEGNDVYEALKSQQRRVQDAKVLVKINASLLNQLQSAIKKRNTDKIALALSQLKDLQYSPSAESIEQFEHALKNANKHKKDKGASNRLNDAIQELAKEVSSVKEEHKEELNIKKEEEVRLYSYWKDAGLEEKTGMTASQYYEDYIKQTQPERRWEEAGSNGEEINPYNLSRVERNNLLFDFMQSRLNDPETALARWIPGGFDEASEAARYIKQLMLNKDVKTEQQAYDNRGEDVDIIYRPISPLATVVYNARNLVAKNIVGIMANHNTSMVLSQAMQSMRLKEEIHMFGNVYQDLLGQTDIRSENSNKSFKNRAMSYLAQLLASSVDAVKDPVLNFLNINSNTANIAALMCRLGMTPKQVGLFLNQPVIKEVCKYMEDNGGHSLTRAIMAVATKSSSENSLNNTIDGTINKFSGTLTEEKLANNILYAKGITDNAEINKNRADDKEILNMFLSLARKAEALSEFINDTKFTANNNLDNTIGSFIVNQVNTDYANTSLIEDTFDMTFENVDENNPNAVNDSRRAIVPNLRINLFGNNDKYQERLGTLPLGIEQGMHDVQEAYVNELSKYLHYKNPTYQFMYQMMMSGSYTPRLKASVINAVNYALPLFIIEHTNVLGAANTLNPDGANHVYPYMTNRDYYTLKFPKELMNFLEERNEIKKEYERLKDIRDSITEDYVEDKSVIYGDTMTEEERVKEHEKYLTAKAAAKETAKAARKRAEDAVDKFMENVVDVKINEFTDKYPWAPANRDIFEDNLILDNLEVTEYESNSPQTINPKNTSEEKEVIKLRNKYYTVKLKNNLQFGKDDISQQAMIEWNNLAYLDDPVYELDSTDDFNATDMTNTATVNLGINLLLYSLNKSGFTSSSDGFASLASPDLKGRLPLFISKEGNIVYYNDYIGRIGETNNNELNDVALQRELMNLIYMNNADDSEFVKQIYSENGIKSIDVAGSINGILKTKKVLISPTNPDILKIPTDEAIKAELAVSDGDETRKMIPCFNIRISDSYNKSESNVLYMLCDSTGNVTSNIDPTFKSGNNETKIYYYRRVPVRNGGDYSDINNSKNKLSPTEGSIMVGKPEFEVYASTITTKQKYDQLSEEEEKKAKKESEDLQDELNMCGSVSGVSPI